MRSAVAVGRSLVAALLALGVLIAATGWLYVFYPKVSLPGPTIRDALLVVERLDAKFDRAPVDLRNHGVGTQTHADRRRRIMSDIEMRAEALVSERQ